MLAARYAVAGDHVLIEAEAEPAEVWAIVLAAAGVRIATATGWHLFGLDDLVLYPF